MAIPGEWGGGVTPYNGLYGEAPPERGTFFRLQVSVPPRYFRPGGPPGLIH